MEFYHFVEQTIQLNNREERARVEHFLANHSLRLEADVDYSIAIYRQGMVVATGSLAGNLLKCIAVDPEYEGRGIAGRVVSRLVAEAYSRGLLHLFIYTKPENAGKFSQLGFYKITEVPAGVVLMENRPDGITAYLKQLKKYKRSAKMVASIVVNCNPFTKGHQYLIEKAARACELLHLFVVWEDRSVFPPEVRYQLVKDGIKHLPNVEVHKGKDYIISNVTFPTYFIKSPDEAVKTQSLLDIKIFAKFIAPALGIKRRYVGTEPDCPVTGRYNQTMKTVLPGYGIEVIELPRLSIKGVVVSASQVRKHLRQRELHLVKELVPEITYNFLRSKDADAVLGKIGSEAGGGLIGAKKNRNGRHT